ncbi:putative alpha-L-fucosidase [Condylostylus longicornis]|uniref:putative alpha-L-fucosidase n=1 Tax=Condylostylus longicornis TaxID=2530218 RepID=UPI00244DB1F6|nr:putative alpha-L-fucosidase [Condylostylus longicornis]
MFKLLTAIVLLLTILKCDVCNAVKKYNPTWESLDSRPLPDWYDNAKVGIFIHWGVYSVPSFGTEWFWINWKGQNVSTYIDFMKKNYKPNFTYQDFAKDFTAELFNATQWSLLFQDSGAKYVVLTSKHHDGFALWPSTKSFSWNSIDIGPKRDIIGELSSSIRQNTNLTFGLYYSLFEWFNRMYLMDRDNGFKSNVYVEDKVWPEMKEIIERYHPDVLWSDGDWETTPDYWKSLEFLAWLYNESPVRNTVVTNDRWGSGVLCKHGDFFTCQDRYNPGILKEHKWENAFTLDKTSWGQRFDTKLSDYMTSEQLIKEIVTTVSCNGNVLVNVGPTKSGTIQPIFEERLRDMGSWLKINGEAIYSTKYWIYQNDTKTEGVWYTMKPHPDIKNRIILYAMILNYPYDTNTIDLESVYKYMDIKSEVTILGLPENIPIKWDVLDSSVLFKLPPKNFMDKYGLKYAWTIKMDVSLENE